MSKVQPIDRTEAEWSRKLTHRQLVELAFVVGLANLTNRFNHALEIEPERAPAG